VIRPPPATRRAVARLAWLIPGLVLGLAGGGTARAADEPGRADRPAAIHLAEVTCRELLAAPGEERTPFLMFVFGYDAGLRRDPVMDASAIRDTSARLAAQCVRYPDDTLFVAFGRLFKAGPDSRRTPPR